MAPRASVVLLALAACRPPAASPPDGGTADAAWVDAGVPDAATPDAATPDAAPPDAAAADAGPVETACANGADDDGDGDADCRDADCEAAAPCLLGENSAEACGDGVDNDGDRYTDCTDYDCADLGPCGPPERDRAACTDGQDNDHDTYTDCDDFGCRGLSVCSPFEDRAAACTDQWDNDGDGYEDCADFGCRDLPVCATTEGDTATCADGVDNDTNGATDCADTACTALAVCTAARLRVVTWNVQQLTGGDPPSAQGQAAVDAVLTMLRRMNPDVACFNEVHDDEATALATAAATAGYPYVFQGSISTPMAGGLTNACLSRRPFLSARSRSSNDISTDPRANETGRDLTEVSVELIPGGARVTLVSAHLKSGFDDATLLRRHVEVLRAAQVVTEAALSGGVLFMGDFNEELDRVPGPVFATPPAGLPYSFRLGSDLHYPFTYDPFGVMHGAGLVDAPAVHEDSTQMSTRIPSGRRIDYIMTRGVEVVAAEVYDPCVDNGVDDAPTGGRMEKAGTPVSCGTAELASDHWPVMVDLLPAP